MLPTRRPVPSKAALRFLRQLAYISSGTACGAAALVAEERRRQTCLAKTIVENSKKLRQHPRYAHTAAALQDQDYTLSEPLDFFGAYNSSLDSRGKEKRPHGQDGNNAGRDDERRNKTSSGYRLVRRKRHKSPAPETVRSQVLPSEVRDGYDRWTERESRRQQASSASTGTLEESSTGKHEHKRSNYNQTTAKLLATQKRTSVTRQRRPGFTRGSFDGISKPSSPVHNTSPRGNSPLSSAEVQSNLMKEKLRVATNAFLADNTYNTDGHGDVASTAATLLKATTELGLMAEAQRIFDWLLLRDYITENQLVHLSAHVDCFTAVHGLSAVHKTCKVLLQHKSLERLDKTIVNRCRIKVMAALLGHNSTFPPKHLDTALFDSVVESISLDKAVSLLEISCQGFLDNKDKQRAVELFLHCMGKRTSDEHCTRLATQLFDACLQSDDFFLCRKILTLLHNQGHSMEELVGKLMMAQVDKGSHTDLVQTYEEWHTSCPLPASAYPLLFVALTELRSIGDAVLIAQHLPTPIPSDLLNSCRPAWTHLLERRWASTKNLTKTMRTFDEIRALAGENGAGLKVYNTMIRISVLAGNGGEAQRLLLQMRDKENLTPDVQTFGNFLLAAAKKNKWTVVQDMLPTLAQLEKSDAEGPSKDVMRVFDLIVSEYAQQNQSGSGNLWEFVHQALEGLNIPPSRAMFSIMLKAFAREKDFLSISQWASYVERNGLNIQINAGHVVDVLKTYYYGFRPSLSRMKALVIKIARNARYLVSEELVLLLRDAAAYDSASRNGDKNARISKERTSNQLASAVQRLDKAALLAPEEYKANRASSSVQDGHKLGEEAGLNNLLARLEEISSDSEYQTSGTAVPLSVADSPNGTTGKLFGQAAKVVRTVPSSDHKHSSSSPESPKLQAHDVFMHKRKAKTEMLLAMSLGQPSAAVEFYKKTLSASGLPPSSVTLDLAIEASLTAHNGDTSEATDLINDAEEAGMDVTSTLTPMLINHFRRLNPDQRRDHEAIFSTVKRFYTEMEAHQIRVSHHVGVTAANLVLKTNPRKAIDLLRSIYSSTTSATRHPLDIVGTTVLLKGYVSLAHITGIRWLMHEILSTNMRIDHRFLQELHNAQKSLGRTQKTQHGEKAKKAIKELADEIQRFRHKCQQRQEEQITEANRVGNKLVDLLVKESKRREGAVKVNIGPPPTNNNNTTTNPTTSPTATSASLLSYKDRRVQYRRLCAMKSRKPSRKMLVKYRARLRRGLVDEQTGRMLSFKYTLPRTNLDRARGRRMSALRQKNVSGQ